MLIEEGKEGVIREVAQGHPDQANGCSGEKMAVAEIAVLGDQDHPVGIGEGGNGGILRLGTIQDSVHMGGVDATLAKLIYQSVRQMDVAEDSHQATRRSDSPDTSRRA